MPAFFTGQQMDKPQISLSFSEATSDVKQVEVEPFQVDIDAVKVRFQNGEVVIVTQSFTDPCKFDLWLSERDPLRPAQILPCLDGPETNEWLKAISYRILKI